MVLNLYNSSKFSEAEFGGSSGGGAAVAVAGESAACVTFEISARCEGGLC